MALKTILVALTTVRGGERVRFPANSVVDLTTEERDELDALQKATGKLHYRTPITEGGKPVESKPVVQGSATPDYDGAQIAIDEKTAPQLKAYLDHFKVEYKGNASKSDLLTLAQTHAATGGEGTAGGSTRDGEGSGDDPDAGL